MKKAAVLLALFQGCTLALGQSGPSTGGGAQGTRFICGGVGLEEQDTIKALASQHDLMLTFALSTGQYLADVDVQIRDDRGVTVLSARCDGPIMLVDLPAPGRYRVTAGANGLERRAAVVTGRRLARVTMTWPAATADTPRP